jgi:negative regulator of replication initiation
MRRQPQNNVLSERASQRLQGIAQTLEQWSRYLDSRENGDLEAASNALRALLQSNSGAPVIPRRDIEAALQTAKPAPTDTNEFFSQHLENVTSLAELKTAADSLRKPDATRSLSITRSIEQQLRKIDTLLAADELANAKNWEAAQRRLDEIQNYGTFNSVEVIVSPLANDLRQRILFARLVEIGGQPAKPDESPDTYAKRIADNLASAEKYEELAKFMDTVSTLLRSGRSSTFTAPWKPGDIVALQSWSNARRFQAAGDYLLALNAYRSAIANGQGTNYVPLDQIQASLKTLIDAHPDLKNDPNNVILQQLQALQDQMRDLQMSVRTMGRYPGMMPR